MEEKKRSCAVKNCFDMPFLQQLKTYYEDRLAEARRRGYDSVDAEYFWLFEELEHRVAIVNEATTAAALMPVLCVNEGGVETALSCIATVICQWMQDEQILKNASQAVGEYFCEEDPYWHDFNEAFEKFGVNYLSTPMPQARADLIEYLACALRLFLHVRERLVCAIDRRRFDGIMRLSTARNAPAEVAYEMG